MNWTALRTKFFKECIIDHRFIHTPAGLFEWFKTNLEPKPIRSNRQNRYLHSIIALYAIETGYTLEEMKTVLKRECGFMVYEKNGVKFLKSSAGMDTKEMTDWIDWIRHSAGMNSIYLPSADEFHTDYDEIEKTIEKNKTYL
jgi:hypothetical protein